MNELKKVYEKLGQISDLLETADLTINERMDLEEQLEKEFNFINKYLQVQIVWLDERLAIQEKFKGKYE